jgi:hypothetical protein
MPTFLSDPPQIVYLLLGGLLVVTGAIAAQYQDRRSALPFGIAFFLILLVFLLDRFSESPREEAVRRVNMMALAADAKNPDAFVAHVAEQVTIQTEQNKTKTVTRDELKKSQFWNVLRQFDVHVAVWDFSRDDVKDFGNGTVEIGFMAKGEVRTEGKPIMTYVRATFTRQNDGSMKMTAFRSYHPTNHDEVFPIPNFP